MENFPDPQNVMLKIGLMCIIFYSDKILLDKTCTIFGCEKLLNGFDIPDMIKELLEVIKQQSCLK